MGTNIAARDAALTLAQNQRSRLADIRRRARCGELTLAELILDPPDELAGWMCIDVVCLTWSKRHSTTALERLGRLALRDGINLMIPIGRASLRTREWIAEHAAWYLPAPGGGRRLTVGVVNGSRDESEAA